MRVRIGSFILVALFLINLSTPALASSNIEDLPRDHWAYESVVELVNRGYMSLHQDNNFNGDNEVSRYELANVVARILRDIEGGRFVAEEGDILTLKNLATEFRVELVEIMRSNESLRDDLDKIEKDQAIVKEDLVDTNYRVNSVERQAKRVLDSLENEAIRIAKLEVELNELKNNNIELQSRVNNLENRSGSQEDVEKLNNRIFWLTGGWIVSTLLLLNN
ncbi:S-layer protein [Halonatronum saccharophilum]|uniref:S-layer protein n=1 Tax=Halonatronum saccharophilum TaxID=150060 RepID=UPI0004B5DB51|nr:S-layer protein [Halonatronum saccharophilum]